MSKKPAGEPAERALCRHDGHPPDIKREGTPMWLTYRDEVDIVLKKVVPAAEFAQ